MAMTEDRPGARIRQLRRWKTMTQEDLARATNLSRASICNIEKGKQQPSLSSIRQIAKVLGVDPKEIMSDV